MVIQLVHLKVKPERIDAFKTATLDNTRNSRAEAGIVQFALIQQQDDPTRFIILEAFKDEAAIEAHRQTPHYQRWKEAVPDMLAEDRRLIKANSVDPSDRDW